MQPWQVSLGLSVATVLPAAFLLVDTLLFIEPFLGLYWDYYSLYVVLMPVTAVLLVVFGYYHVARVLFLGDVGSRLRVMDKSIRSGSAGDPELAAALEREQTGDYES